jgi:hypothetical protein
MKWMAACLIALAPLAVRAEWIFSAPVRVSQVQAPSLFHHLESSNRKGLARSGADVALVWEDNREGAPHCYLALRETNETAFRPEQPITPGECFQPVVQGLGRQRFALAWEEDGAVWVKQHATASAVKLSEQEAGQVTLAWAGGDVLYAAWVELDGRFQRVMLARLRVQDDGLAVEYRQALEDRPPLDGQAYPALLLNEDGSLVAVWEDRRFKHTVLLAAYSQDGLHFARPYRLIDIRSGRMQGLGAGTGAMRPTLAGCGGRCVVAAWLDKRDFMSGYDVYAAISNSNGRFFGRNIQVQDSFGDNVAQWHASVSANRHGRIVVTWDDDRDGSPDVLLATWTGNGFSDNLPVPGASGAGAQSDAVSYLDDSGMLHLAWVDQQQEGGTTLNYLTAIWKD